jgi:hypothetical protein
MRRARLPVALLALLALAAAADASAEATAAGATIGDATAGSSAQLFCGSFRAQADAQEAFIAAGGGPGRDLGAMDPDHDGVACEALGAPYLGFATIGYNRRGQFLFGTATMPSANGPPGDPPCLAGNTHFAKGPRELQVFRVTPDGPRPVLAHRIGAEARPGSARLLWKATRSHLLHAVYYVEFDERVRLSPNGRNECPALASRPTRLPAAPAGR